MNRSKSFTKLELLVCTTIVALLSFFVVRRVQVASYDASRVVTYGCFYQLGFHVVEYSKYIHKKFPEYVDPETGNENWSWRRCLPERGHASYMLPGVDFSKSWNDPDNLPIVTNGEKANFNYYSGSEREPKHYTADGLQAATFVAVKGPGTVWTEVNEGRLSFEVQAELLNNKIILIETTEPKCFWAEPGDDVTPDDVIRMFQADPGLVKNSAMPKRFRKHWPRNFIRVDGSRGRFDRYENVEDLRRDLLCGELKPLEE